MRNAPTIDAAARETAPVQAESWGSLLGDLYLLLERWVERRRQRRALLELGDALLKDIGISRADALREASKPFWRR
jgi:uncharacterized protein YjiS (DUF1127 family)